MTLKQNLGGYLQLYFSYILKEEISQIHDLSFHPRTPEKEDKMKPKINKQKGNKKDQIRNQ